jgi:hypothetical protein
MREGFGGIARICLMACCCALASCGDQTPPVPKLSAPPKVVFVPTPVACINPADIPVEPSKVPQAGTVIEDLRIASAQAVKLRTYAEKLLDIAQGCSRIKP